MSTVTPIKEINLSYSSSFDGSSLRIGIVHARWNAPTIAALLKGTRDKLMQCGVKSQDIVVQEVSIPSGSFDAVIAIGVLIKGVIMYFEYISKAVTGNPREEQALERAGIGKGGSGKGHNHGEDWGAAAVEMTSNNRKWAAGNF
ncbi:hypothetical protein Clacol_006386 [Clathrus columnatus]|uniref:6,7-dimethyl-8-ribityllumazine synthase n=1 Tax=Clathrus columnatus TaxID=1419009 RepID=A0AAV5AJL6_9AGAM|nr:hypothetical protein Clacol_006386 [Clathrus columnatus]